MRHRAALPAHEKRAIHGAWPEGVNPLHPRGQRVFAGGRLGLAQRVGLIGGGNSGGGGLFMGSDARANMDMVP